MFHQALLDVHFKNISCLLTSKMKQIASLNCLWECDKLLTDVNMSTTYNGFASKPDVTTIGQNEERTFSYVRLGGRIKTQVRHHLDCSKIFHIFFWFLLYSGLWCPNFNIFEYKI